VPATTKQSLLRQAARRIGVENLATGLKVPLPLVEAWLEGLATMPDQKLIALAELLDSLLPPPD